MSVLPFVPLHYSFPTLILLLDYVVQVCFFMHEHLPQLHLDLLSPGWAVTY